MFPKFSIKKKQPKPLDAKSMTEILQRQAELQKQNFDEILRGIEKDKEKTRIWNSLSSRDKIRMLHIIERGKREKQVSGKNSWFKNKKKKI